jgi:multidrug efflux pump subunit AcrA (membrane-fusion protein)
VLVSLTHPKAAGKLNQAPVTVLITTGSVADVLTVPVDALLARPHGGYAVEVVSGGRRHLVKVTPGMFDDAAGLVQVSGPGLSPGQRVVVPGI